MESWQIIVGGILFLVAALILSYTSKTRKKDGPLLSQSYLALSDEEKKFFDKDKEFERITILYGLIGVFFIFVALTILTMNKVFAILSIVALGADLMFSLLKIIEARKNI